METTRFTTFRRRTHALILTSSLTLLAAGSFSSAHAIPKDDPNKTEEMDEREREEALGMIPPQLLRMAKGIVNVKGEITEESMEKAIGQIEQLEIMVQNPKGMVPTIKIPTSAGGRQGTVDVPVITVEIDSPGGSVSAGMKLFNKLRDLEEKNGIFVHTVCNGSCASMGAAIFSAGTKGLREARRTSRLMLHGAAYGVEGKTGTMLGGIAESESFLYKQFYEFLAERTDLDMQTLLDFMGNDDMWLAPEHAAAIGLLELIDGARVDKAVLLAAITGEKHNLPTTIEKHIRDTALKLAEANDDLVTSKIALALRQQAKKKTKAKAN